MLGRWRSAGSGKCWLGLPCGVLRRAAIDHVIGGFSYVLKILISVFFTSAESFSESGVVIDLGSGSSLFFARNANVLADKDALEQIWSFKCSSGFSCCPLCDALMVGALTDPSVSKRSGKHVLRNYMFKERCIRGKHERLNFHSV